MLEPEAEQTLIDAAIGIGALVFYTIVLARRVRTERRADHVAVRLVLLDYVLWLLSLVYLIHVVWPAPLVHTMIGVILLTSGMALAFTLSRHR